MSISSGEVAYSCNNTLATYQIWEKSLVFCQEDTTLYKAKVFLMAKDLQRNLYGLRCSELVCSLLSHFIFTEGFIRWVTRFIILNQ